MANLGSDLKLFDPTQGNFVDLDGGKSSTFAVLYAILVELRVHTQYLAAMNTGIINDDPASIRTDVSSDPGLIQIFNPTSNF